MIVVYGAGGGAGSIELVFGGGHASIAFTRAARYVSWVRTENSKSILTKFKKGIWSDPTYRVEIPTAEDGNEGALSEQDALNEWENGVVEEGKQYAERMRHELGNDNPAYRRYAAKGEDGGFSLEYQHLHEKYNCVEIVKRLLTAAGGYERIGWVLPTLTVAGVCRDAGAMHVALVNPQTSWGAAPNGFFGEDINVGKSILPFPHRSKRPG